METTYYCCDCFEAIPLSEYESLDNRFCPKCGGHIEQREDSDEVPREEKHRTKMSNEKRDPGLASVLSIFLPGLGHVYAGNLAKGIALPILLPPLSFLFAFILLVTSGAKYALILGIILFPCLYLFIIIDAYKTARNQDEEYVLKRFNKWYVYLVIFVVFGLILQTASSVFVRNNYVQAFKIPSGAMLPTLMIGDHILVDKTIDPISDLKINEIIVFQFPKDTNISYVKRVVGLPGDTIELKNKKLFRNGAKADDPHVHYTSTVILPGSVSPKDNFGPVVVLEGDFFVLGDNRDNSSDSRFWGFVPLDLIEGRVLNVYWSWDIDKPLLSIERFASIRWNRIGHAFQ